MKHYLKLFELTLETLIIIITFSGIIWYIWTDTYAWIDKIPIFLIMGLLHIRTYKHQD